MLTSLLITRLRSQILVFLDWLSFRFDLLLRLYLRAVFLILQFAAPAECNEPHYYEQKHESATESNQYVD